MEIQFDNIYGALLGVAIGDKLGQPLEKMKAEEIAEKYGMVTDYIEGSTTTDDWQLTKAVTESIIEAGLNIDSQARFHVQSLAKYGNNGFGRATRESIGRLAIGVHWSQSGSVGAEGNGILMKLIPIIIALKVWDTILLNDPKFIARFTKMTHNSILNLYMVNIYILTCLSIINEWKKQTLVDKIDHLTSLYEPPPLFDLSNYYYNSNKDLPKNTGFTAMDTVAIILQCVLGGPEEYPKLSLAKMYDVVNIGGDTDTNASIYASLLGLQFGPTVFPTALRKGVEDMGIADLANKFYNRLYGLY